jgi:hypothetical protein
MIPPELRETLIIAILQQLDAVHPSTLSAQTLLIPLRQSGLADLNAKDLGSLLADLEEKGWVCPQAGSAVPELTRFKRTEAGRSYLRQSGF